MARVPSGPIDDDVCSAVTSRPADSQLLTWGRSSRSPVNRRRHRTGGERRSAKQLGNERIRRDRRRRGRLYWGSPLNNCDKRVNTLGGVLIDVCTMNDLVAPNGSHGSSGFALLRRGQSVRRHESLRRLTMRRRRSRECRRVLLKKSGRTGAVFRTRFRLCRCGDEDAIAVHRGNLLSRRYSGE